MTRHDRPLHLESEIYKWDIFPDLVQFNNQLIFKSYTEHNGRRCNPNADIGAADNQAPACGREGNCKRAFSLLKFCFRKLNYQSLSEFVFEKNVPSQLCPILQLL